MPSIWGGVTGNCLSSRHICMLNRIQHKQLGNCSLVGNVLYLTVSLGMFVLRNAGLVFAEQPFLQPKWWAAKMASTLQILETSSHKYLWSTYCTLGTLQKKRRKKKNLRVCCIKSFQHMGAFPQCMALPNSEEEPFLCRTSAGEGMPPSVGTFHNPQVRGLNSVKWSHLKDREDKT